MYLNKSFPFIEHFSHQLITSFIFSLFIYLFLLIFQPFGISNISISIPIFIIGFAVITFVVMILVWFVVIHFFDYENWNIKLNYIYIFIIIFFVTILNWQYENYFISYNKYSLVNFIGITISVGTIPTVLFVYFIEKYLFDMNNTIAEDINTSIEDSIHLNNNNYITIPSKNLNENLKIEIDLFICAKSEGNYVNVFYIDDGITKTKLLRNSISNIETYQNKNIELIRCHRSFIVNFRNIDRVSGNARNFNLHCKHLQFSIPVSRSFSKDRLKELSRS